MMCTYLVLIMRRLGYQFRNNRPWTASRRTLTDSGVSDTENPDNTMHFYKEK